MGIINGKIRNQEGLLTGKWSLFGARVPLTLIKEPSNNKSNPPPLRK